MEGKCSLPYFWKPFCGFLVPFDSLTAHPPPCLTQPESLSPRRPCQTQWLQLFFNCRRLPFLQLEVYLTHKHHHNPCSFWSAQFLVESHLCTVPADHTKGSFLVTPCGFDLLSCSCCPDTDQHYHARLRSFFIIRGVCFKLVIHLFYTPF